MRSSPDLLRSSCPSPPCKTFQSPRSEVLERLVALSPTSESVLVLSLSSIAILCQALKREVEGSPFPEQPQSPRLAADDTSHAGESYGHYLRSLARLVQKP